MHSKFNTKMHFSTLITVLFALATKVLAQTNFRISHSNCPWVVLEPEGGYVDDEDYYSFQAGSGGITCDSFNNLPEYNGLINNSPSFFSANVCNMQGNFYLTNGNYDFYQSGGDGTLLGTCYPSYGTWFSCFEGLSSCAIHEAYHCDQSNNAPPPC